MDPPFDATYGGFLDDDFVMQPLEAKAGITTFAGPAGVVYETIPPPPGAAFPMPAVEPPFYPSFNASTPQHFGPSGPWHHQGHVGGMENRNSMLHAQPDVSPVPSFRPGPNLFSSTTARTGGSATLHAASTMHAASTPPALGAGSSRPSDVWRPLIDDVWPPMRPGQAPAHIGAPPPLANAQRHGFVHNATSATAPGADDLLSSSIRNLPPPAAATAPPAAATASPALARPAPSPPTPASQVSTPSVRAVRDSRTAMVNADHSKALEDGLPVGPISADLPADGDGKPGLERLLHQVKTITTTSSVLRGGQVFGIRKTGTRPSNSTTGSIAKLGCCHGKDGKNCSWALSYELTFTYMCYRSRALFRCPHVRGS